MKRLTIAIAVLAALFGGPAMSGQGKDLAGTWVLDTEKTDTKDAPPMVILSLTDKEFTARFGNEKARSMSFSLDGTEKEMPDGHKTKATWKGARLEATVTAPGRGPETVVFSRDGNWLIVEPGSTGHGPAKLYFKKAPAK
jgi:hypothetical protein